MGTGDSARGGEAGASASDSPELFGTSWRWLWWDGRRNGHGVADDGNVAAGNGAAEADANGNSNGPAGSWLWDDLWASSRHGYRWVWWLQWVWVGWAAC